MSEDRSWSSVTTPRITPWVGRLMVIHAIAFILFRTVVTEPSVLAALRWSADHPIDRPWTFLSYTLVPAGLVALLANLFLLYAFGPPVERRLGGRGFILYYCYCGLGVSGLALGLSGILHDGPVAGATGAALGIALAFALNWPDAELVLSPAPLRLNARTVLLLLAGVHLVLSLWVTNGALHIAHLGGIAAGYLFFRIQGLALRRVRPEPAVVTRRPVMAPIPARQGGPETDLRPALARPEPRMESPPLEIDRVLDKISAFGMQSLTAEERRFLDEVSKRKRNDQH